MPPIGENLFTEIEAVLKAALEDPANVSLGGIPVPVRVVAPDQDLVELELPVTTLTLQDVRRGLDRMDNAPEVEPGVLPGDATVRWPSQPWDLLYSVRGHTASSREDRLLLGQYLRFLDDHPFFVAASGGQFLLGRDRAFRDQGRAGIPGDDRAFAKSVSFTVRARFRSGVEAQVPTVTEQQIQVGQMTQQE